MPTGELYLFKYPVEAVSSYLGKEVSNCQVLLIKNTKDCYISTSTLGELPKTKRREHYLLLITDSFSKLTKAMPLKKTSATAVARAFLNHRVIE